MSHAHITLAKIIYHPFKSVRLPRCPSGSRWWCRAVPRGLQPARPRQVAGLTRLLQESWLGDPLAPETDEEETAVLRTRRVVFGGRETEPTKHLGEAMTLVLIETREELRGSWWVTDDREAAEHADRKGITTRDTMHIMGELVSEGTLTAVDGFALMQTMRDRDRHMRMPGSPRDLQ